MDNKKNKRSSVKKKRSSVKKKRSSVKKRRSSVKKRISSIKKRRSSVKKNFKFNKNSLSKCNQNYSIKKQIEFLNNLNSEKNKNGEFIINFAIEYIDKINSILNNNMNYPNIHSYYQIQTIINSFKYKKNLEDFKRLIYLIWKKFSYIDFDNLYNMLISKERNDLEYFSILKKINESNKNKFNNNKFNNKNKFFMKIYQDKQKDVLNISKFIYYELNLFLNDKTLKFKKINKYLDIGCGSGYKTIKLGNLLGLTKENIYCADINEWFDYNDQNRLSKNFSKLELVENKKLDLKDNSIDVISLIHVLHHMKDFKFRIKNIFNILKKNGILIIVEHDVMTINDFCLTDIEHTLYEINTSNKIKNFYRKDNKGFYSNYMNWIEVNILMKENGFKFIKRIPFNRGNVRNIFQPTLSYVSFFQK